MLCECRVDRIECRGEIATWCLRGLQYLLIYVPFTVIKHLVSKGVVNYTYCGLLVVTLLSVGAKWRPASPRDWLCLIRFRQ